MNLVMKSPSERLIEIEEMLLKICKIMEFENPVLNVEIDPNMSGRVIITYGFLPDGRLSSTLFLKGVYEANNIVGLLGHEIGHTKFNKDHPMIQKFLNYLNWPHDKILKKYHKSPLKLLAFYFPYTLREYLATRESKKRRINTRSFPPY